MTEHKKPDFICIGPDRTGTGWLYHNLRQHPQVWLPPVKEISALAEGRTLPAYSLRKLAFSDHWYYNVMRSRPHRVLAKVILGKERFSNFGWTLRYVFRPGAPGFSYAWYAALFENKNNLISGDISPAYYYLPEVEVKKLGQIFSASKILIFVRNPIARVWSTVQHELARLGYPNASAAPPEKIRAYFDFHANQPAYSQKIEFWQQSFQQVFVGRFDDLKDSPDVLFKDICDFLAIPVDLPQDQLQKKVNQGRGQSIPPEFAAILRQQYQDEIYRLAELGYCRDPQAWLDYESA